MFTFPYLKRFIFVNVTCILIPFSGICQSETETNKQITQRLVNEWFNKHDTSLFEKFVHPDYKGFGGKESRNEYRQQVMASFHAFPDLTMKILQMIAEGNKVAILFTYSGTHKGMFAGILPTNKTISWTGISILTYKDGKLIDRWNESDALKLMTEIGGVRRIN